MNMRNARASMVSFAFALASAFALTLVSTSLAGCGRQLVEFRGADAAPTDGGNTDVAHTDLASTDVPHPDVAGTDLNLDLAGTDLNLDLAGLDLNLDLAGLDLPNIDGANIDLVNIDAPDTMPPTVIATTPMSDAMNVSSTSIISGTFSEPMDGTTITMVTFTLRLGGTPLVGPVTPVVGAVTYDAFTRTATFVPSIPLMLATTYTATISTGVKDSSGNPMANDYTWTFMTSASSCTQSAVVLGAADSFVVLSGPSITNTGLTSVIGDMGTSPGTAVTGFGPGVLVGALHAGDPISAAAEAALTIAFNDAAGRSLCPVSISGNLGGMTLTPGLYKSTGSLEISSGNLVLDAQGDTNGVFIFQMASTLTTTSGRQVILNGGAKSANVFWQVGSSATLGSTSAFQGTIMADQAISLDTGATLNGRLLARIAGITLDSNVIVKPLP